MSNADMPIDVVIEKLEQERRIYAKLHELSTHQMEIILNDDEDGGVERLMDVLARKQGLINELESLEADLAGFRRDWDELRETLSPTVREAVEQRIRDITRLLTSVLRLEERGRERFQECTEGVREEILKVGHTQKAHQVYAGVAKPSVRRPNLVDDKG
jgi:hypothetical protein